MPCSDDYNQQKRSISRIVGLTTSWPYRAGFFFRVTEGLP